jgi:hypothetical protein
MFVIEVTCGMFLCAGLPDLSQRYNSVDECNRALVRLVHSWKPPENPSEQYMYTFNCRLEIRT